MVTIANAEFLKCSGPGCQRRFHHLCSIKHRQLVSPDIDIDENDKYNCGCHNKGTWSKDGSGTPVFTRNVESK